LAASLACRTLGILPLQLCAFAIDPFADNVTAVGQIFFKQTVSFLIENGIDRIERGFDFRRTAP